MQTNKKNIFTFETLAKFGVFIYFAIFFILDSGYSWGIVFTLLLSLIFIGRNFKQIKFKPAWLFILLFSYFILNVLFVLFKSDIIFQIDLASRIGLSAFVLVFLWNFRISPKIIILGLILGALLGFLLGFYQYNFLGISRAYGRAGSSIWFGNFSALFSLLILIGFVYKPIFKNIFLSRLVVFLASGLAAYSALISNTKSSWIVLIVGLAFIVFILFKSLNSKTRILFIVLLFVSCFTIVMQPRFQAMIQDFEVTKRDPNSYGSNFARIDMYEVGIRIFLEHPLTGVGRVGIKQAVDDLPISDAKKVMPKGHPHLHNDFIDMAARYGILGFLAVFLLYVLPLIYFLKNVFHKDENYRYFALSGFISVISYICFSMFETPLYHNIGVMNYGFLVILFSSGIEYLNNIKKLNQFKDVL